MEKELVERLQVLQSEFGKIQPSLNLADKKKEYEQLKGEMESPDFWNEPERAQNTSQKSARLEDFITTWETFQTNLRELPELIEIASESELPDLEKEIQSLEAQFRVGEQQVLLSGEYDDGNVILTLHVGNGGQDAEDFTQMLQRMYLRFCERKNFKARILDESASDAGLRSATIEIKGDWAYGLLKSEHGIHRLIRLSPFNAKSLRQTSFTRIEVLPEIEDDATVEIDEKDLKIDVFRSSGAGGQSVNTTDSAVRITYLPLNIVVTCQNERSQLQNKETALKIIKSRLAQLQLEQQAQKIDELRGEQMEAAFGSQIRTYTLQPYKLVKDHRTDTEHTNPDKVFDGDLDLFMDAYLRMEAV